MTWNAIKPASHSYTSMKDLLPSVAVNSPRPKAAGHPATNISIRNRLVQQAAWAYLQPMATSSGSVTGNFFQRVWPRFAAVIDFIRTEVVRALNWMIRITGSKVLL